ncbi:TPA: antibiotic biosynthesis monooxygenase [Escherichia coli]|nr:antibiotic biosynthesis monooxygenase [Escherichia coli]
MKNIVCVARYKAKKERLNDLILALQELTPPTRQEAGCLQYDLCHEPEYKEAAGDIWDVCFIEKWKSILDFELHCNKPYIKSFFNEESKKIVEKSDIRIFSMF